MANKQIYYQQRKDLTQTEKTAISHYKDITNPQLKWDYKPKNKPKNVGIDCHIINNVLRGKIDYNSLSPNDKRRFTYISNNLSNAIKKSKISKDISLYKGISPYPELKKFESAGYFRDKGFCSFSDKIVDATRYSEIYKGFYLFYVVILKKGDSALYIDADENEYIINKGTKFTISDVVEYNAGEFFSKPARIYYLSIT